MAIINIDNYDFLYIEVGIDKSSFQTDVLKNHMTYIVMITL